MARSKFFSRVFKTVMPVILLISVISFRCKLPGHRGDDPESADSSLKLVASYQLDIEEPSGITFNHDYTACWIVDGHAQRIYKTDLKGNIIEKLHYKGDDIEGIFFRHSDSSLWIAEERSREVVHLNLKGNEIERFYTGIHGSDNKGLEGLAFDDKNTLFVLKEKDPASVFLLDDNFEVLKQYSLNFADDLSDMDFDPTSGNFFILSDESRSVYVWNPAGRLVKKYLLALTKCEGIAVNPVKKKILIVNDALNTLYEYEYK
jgi:uncharacterized protein YjiK